MVTLKYEKIILYIKTQVKEGHLKVGAPLPSINSICSQFNTARETVVKAYKILKDEGLIESKPGKGFFLLKESIDFKPSIFLMLNSFNPYMEVLYNSFKATLEETHNVDIYFHHNNIDVFKSLLLENRNRYDSFVVKPFLHPEVPQIFKKLEGKYLLILDRQEYITPESPFVCQDFRHGFYTGLTELTHKFKHYKCLSYIHSSINPHPEESEFSFIQFVNKNNLEFSIISHFDKEKIEKNHVYVVVSDDDMILILKKAKEEDWILGQDIGVITYNDTPLHEFISGGITTISTDFAAMGLEAAKYARSREYVQEIIPTRLILRSSL